MRDGMRGCTAEAGDAAFCPQHAADLVAEARLVWLASAEREVLRWLRRDVVCELAGCLADYWPPRIALMSGPGKADAALILGGQVPAWMRRDSAPMTESASFAMSDFYAALRPHTRVSVEAAA